MSKTKISIIFGTRPEAIKMAMLVHAFKKQEQIDVNVCFSGQHREMVLPIIEFFGLQIDHSMDIMTPNQTLATLSAKAIQAFDAYFEATKPDLIFVQGDTTTAMCAATAAFYRKINIGHVEAGLRTYNLQAPFPEEFNRQVISRIADIHFAPTTLAEQHLLNENINPANVFVTGNTVIDALLFTKQKIASQPTVYKKEYPWTKDHKPYVLITGHRRENFGEGFEHICEAINTLATKYPRFNFVYPVHLNPNVQEPVYKYLSHKDNIYLTAPFDYIQFTDLLADCYLILTDSGGVQEEAPSLGKPVLVMRETTERQEAINAGVAKLVGTDKEKIIYEVSTLIEDASAYAKMSNAQNPYGSGNTAQQIVDCTLRFLNKK